MGKIRLIARLDIKGPNVIKGIHLEGFRVVGKPEEMSTRYYHAGIDEIIYMDTVASLYGRNSLEEIVRHTARNVFIPLTVGGGIRSVEDVSTLLASGADKVAINTAAVKNPGLIREVSRRFGSQCMVLSVEAKRNKTGGWEAYTDNGREHSGLEVSNWIEEAVSLGAGEVLLTSIDQEGTGKGFDIELIKSIATKVSIPVIASGGMGNCDDLVKATLDGQADAVAMAHVLHFNRITLDEIREHAQKNGISVRSR